MKINQRKGQIVGGPLSLIIGLVFSLFMVGILLFAFSLAGSQMVASTTDTAAKAVILNTTQGASGLAAFTPVLWIMTGVGALIVIVVSAVGAYMLTR